jgi:site-specific recombinase XerD
MREVADFLHYCRVERRLDARACSAYERDVAACLRFLEAEGPQNVDIGGVPNLRHFLVR